MLQTEATKQWNDLDGLKIHSKGLKEAFTLSLHQYSNGRPAIQATDVEGMPWCKLTVNLEEEELKSNQFFVKLDGYGEGILTTALYQAGLAQSTGRTVASGMVAEYAEVWQLTVDGIQWRADADSICVYKQHELTPSMADATAMTDTASTWYINRIKVDDKHQGNGLGTKMLTKMIELCKQQGAVQIMVEPGGYGSDLKRQRAFYERAGFVAEGDKGLYVLDPRTEHPKTSCKRSSCTKPLAYPGAIFCGAGCTARYEGGEL